MITIRSPFTLCAIVALAALLAACGGTSAASTPSTTTTTLVGPVTGSQTLVGVVYAPEGVIAYACDSQTIGEWFRAEGGGDGPRTLTSANGATLQLEARTAQGVNGTLALAGGQPQPFALAPANGDAGLYRAKEMLGGVEYVGGWVLANDQQRGLVQGGGQTFAVTLNPADLTVEVPGKGKLKPHRTSDFVEKTF